MVLPMNIEMLLVCCRYLMIMRCWGYDSLEVLNVFMLTVPKQYYLVNVGFLSDQKVLSIVLTTEMVVNLSR